MHQISDFPAVINKPVHMKGKYYLSFGTSEVLRLHRSFECLGKDKCSEILLGENVVVACTERQPLPK